MIRDPRHARRMLALSLAAGALAAACSSAGSATDPASKPSAGAASDAAATPGDPGYRVINVFPHDPAAFTQGLAFHRGLF